MRKQKSRHLRDHKFQVKRKRPDEHVASAVSAFFGRDLLPELKGFVRFQAPNGAWITQTQNPALVCPWPSFRAKTEDKQAYRERDREQLARRVASFAGKEMLPEFETYQQEQVKLYIGTLQYQTRLGHVPRRNTATWNKKQ